MIGAPVPQLRLSRKTKAAWKRANVVFFHTNRSVDHFVEVMRAETDNVLCLGASQLRQEDFDALPIRIWNPMDVVEPLLTPGKLRRSPLGEFLPPREPANNLVWLKGPGFGGRNKQLLTYNEALSLYNEHSNWDWQMPIDGKEYRVHTVNDRVVQVHDRYGPNGERLYEWRGVSNAPRGLIPFVKRLAQAIPDYNTMIGWDIIHSNEGEWFLFEPNFCPGVNDATAQRITDQIQTGESR